MLCVTLLLTVLVVPMFLTLSHFFINMLTIQLLNLPFYSYHGVYDEEKKLGGAYEVTVLVRYTETTIPVLHITETIDYVAVYNLIKQRMQQPRALLETVATTLAGDIFSTFTEVEEVCVEIIKKHPPIPNFEGSIGVKWEGKRTSDSRMEN